MVRWTPRVRWSVGLAAVAAVVVACTQSMSAGGSTAVSTMGTDTLRRIESFSLFDGRTLNGWRVYKGSTQPTGWRVSNGTLTKDRPTDDIITTEQFSNFQLDLEWKVEKGGNAGIFYRVTEEYDKPYWSGVEYQLLDDPNHPDGKNRLTAAGAAYGLYPAMEGIVKPAGEWNSTRIVARGAHVEHWLNGKKLLEYENGSSDWNARVQASKFSAWPNFARARRGYIAIQGDHTGELAFRNIRIRELR